MILHANAALSGRQRERLVALVAAGVTITAAALVVGCSRQTASKWVGRARRGEGLTDRSSRPRRSPRRTPAAVEQAVLRARRELRVGPHPLGWALGLAASTVHAILCRYGCSRLTPRRPREEVVRYERADEKADSALAFLAELERFYGRHGIRVERVLTDNGTCFKRRWQLACEQRGIGVRKTRPYRPQTNGKVERFIRTLLELWAYAHPYRHERERAAALTPTLDTYNHDRRHRALGGLTPLQRVNDLSGTNT